MKEDIYKAKVSIKARFDPKDFYDKFVNFLFSLGWVGKMGKDAYETYQYHRITPEGIEFFEIVFEMTKTFQEEEPKIVWYLKIPIKITAYDRRTSVGTVEVEISASHEVEEKNPEIKSFSEKFLSYLGFTLEILKRNYEKSRTKPSVKRSASSLSKECEDIRKWILDYFKAYY